MRISMANLVATHEDERDRLRKFQTSEKVCCFAAINYAAL